MNPFVPQAVHPNDFHKFSEPVPANAIFASNSETEAKIFAALSGIKSFMILPRSQKEGITVSTESKIEKHDLEGKVYVYRFDSEGEGWNYIEESKEWYNTKEQIPIEITEYKREELYNELRENPDITFEIGFSEKDISTIS